MLGGGVVVGIVYGVALYGKVEATEVIEHNGVTRLQLVFHLRHEGLYCCIYIGFGKRGVSTDAAGYILGVYLVSGNHLAIVLVSY